MPCNYHKLVGAKLTDVNPFTRKSCEVRVAAIDPDLGITLKNVVTSKDVFCLNKSLFSVYDFGNIISYEDFFALIVRGILDGVVDQRQHSGLDAFYQVNTTGRMGACAFK